MEIEEMLKEYGARKRREGVSEDRLREVMAKSREAFWEGEAGREISWLEFLRQQASYIQKRWWAAQGAVLALLWLELSLSGGSSMARRCTGVLIPCFAILILPELWKNRSSGSLEVEGAAYFSLQKVYAARLTLFGMADVCLLSAFLLVMGMTVRIEIWDLLIQFVLPLNVTCCICFRSLCGGERGSVFSALGGCFFWVCLWTLLILDDRIYGRISLPVWAGALALSAVYLGYSIRRIFKWEREECTYGA